MLAFLLRRLGLLLPTFFGVTLLTFALIRLIPGDPVEVMMGERHLDPQACSASASTSRCTANTWPTSAS